MKLEFQLLILALAVGPGLLWLFAAAAHPGIAVRLVALLRVAAGLVAGLLSVLLFPGPLAWPAFVFLVLLPMGGAPLGLVLAASRRSWWAWLGCITGWMASLGAFVCVGVGRSWASHPGTSMISSSSSDSEMLFLVAAAAWLGCWTADGALAILAGIDGVVGRRTAATRP